MCIVFVVRVGNADGSGLIIESRVVPPKTHLETDDGYFFLSLEIESELVRTKSLPILVQHHLYHRAESKIKIIQQNKLSTFRFSSASFSQAPYLKSFQQY